MVSILVGHIWLVVGGGIFATAAAMAMAGMTCSCRNMDDIPFRDERHFLAVDEESDSIIDDESIIATEFDYMNEEKTNEISETKQMISILKDFISKFDDKFVEVHNLKLFSSKIMKQNEQLLQIQKIQDEKINKLIDTIDTLKDDISLKNDLIQDKLHYWTQKQVEQEIDQVKEEVLVPAETILSQSSQILTDSTSPGVDDTPGRPTEVDTPDGNSVGDGNNNNKPSKKKKKSSGYFSSQKSMVEDAEKVKIEYNGTLVQVLTQVLSNIKLDPEERKKRNEELQMIVQDRVLKRLKEDPLFNLLFQEIAGTGSFYEGLKVSKPDEFDLNMIMKLPNMPKRNNEKEVNNANGPKVPYIEITSNDTPAGFMKIRNFGAVLKYLRETNDPNYMPYRKMESWCDEEGSLLQSKFRAWLEGLMTKFIEAHKLELMKTLKLNHLRLRKSGPAMTLEMDSVSIDLVPAIEVKPEYQKESYTDFRPLPVDPVPLPFYLVPKPSTTDGNDDAWRFSAYRHERRMIEGQASLKPAIKLFKKLRDTQNWKNLHSYYIKSAAFWILEENSINWNLKIDGVFVSFLKAVHKRLIDNTIFHFWNKNYNMLQGMSAIQRENIVNKLNKIINTYENNGEPTFLGKSICPHKD